MFEFGLNALRCHLYNTAKDCPTFSSSNDLHKGVYLLQLLFSFTLKTYTDYTDLHRLTQTMPNVSVTCNFFKMKVKAFHGISASN